VADQETEHLEQEAPSGSEPTHEGSDDARLTRLENGLAEVLAFLKGGEAKAEPEPERDIKAEVREAVREVQRQDKDKAAKAEEAKSLQDQIADLKAQIETPPFEYRRVTQAMGWNRP
jgi:hypothetical protein